MNNYRVPHHLPLRPPQHQIHPRHHPPHGIPPPRLPGHFPPHGSLPPRYNFRATLPPYFLPPAQQGNAASASYQSKRRNICYKQSDEKYLRALEEKSKSIKSITVNTVLTRLSRSLRQLDSLKAGEGSNLEECKRQVTQLCTESNKRKLKMIIDKRKNKKKKRQSKAERTQAKISALHKEIDHWRATMLAQHHKQKQDAQLESEAGNTLSQVLQKEKRTQKLLETVKLLIELRSVRKSQAARKHGTFTLPEHDKQFNKNVSKIKDDIKAKLETFYAEEKALKVLMDRNEADIWGVERKLRQLDPVPTNVIDYSCVYLEIQHCPRTLVKIRSEWDEMIVGAGTPNSSRIPSLPLAPPRNPSGMWEQFQRKYTVESD